MRGERIKAKGDGLLRWKTTPAALGFEPNRKARLHFRWYEFCVELIFGTTRKVHVAIIDSREA